MLNFRAGGSPRRTHAVCVASMFVLTSLAACSSPDDPNTARVDTAATVTVTVTATPTDNPPDSPTPTDAPSNSETATPTSAPTSPPTPTETPSPEPAVSWQPGKYAPGGLRPSRLPPPLPRSQAAAFIATGDWDAALKVPTDLGPDLVKCDYFKSNTGAEQWTYTVGSESGLTSEYGLEGGAGWLSISILEAGDGPGVEVLLALDSDGSTFTGSAGNRVVIGNEPKFVWTWSKDHKQISVGARPVMQPEFDYSRYAEVGETSLTVTIRCPK